MGVIDFVLIAAGYLCGSIPFGLILFKLVKGKDVREFGSGNIGATNVARNGGWGVGLATGLLDVAKGLVPVLISLMMGLPADSWTPAIVAVAAIVGHMFPVWLGFKGGKGVATACGVFFGLSWQVALVALVAFVAAIYFFRIVSLGSLIAAVSFGIAAFTLGYYVGMSFQLQIAALVAVLLIVFKHHENIKRLLAGTEKRFSAGGKKQEDAV